MNATETIIKMYKLLDEIAELATTLANTQDRSIREKLLVEIKLNKAEITKQLSIWQSEVTYSGIKKESLII